MARADRDPLIILHQVHSGLSIEAQRLILEAVPNGKIVRVDTEFDFYDRLPEFIQHSVGRPTVLVTDIMSRIQDVSDSMRPLTPDSEKGGFVSAGIRMQRKAAQSVRHWERVVRTTLELEDVAALRKMGERLPNGVTLLPDQDRYNQVGEVVRGLLTGRTFPELMRHYR